MVEKYFILLLSCLLIGCANISTNSSGALPDDGLYSPTPKGYEEMCEREPESVLCNAK